MRLTMRILVLGSLVVGLMGCSDTNNDSSHEGWDVSSRADTGLDADRGDDTRITPADYKVNFELQNDSGRPIYAYTTVENSICGFRGKDWLSIQSGGESVQASEDCSVCTCGEEGCGVCNVACPDPLNIDLASGDARRFEWDGRVWTKSSESCETPALAAGETLQAKICYGFERSGDGETTQIVDPICETIEFTLDRPEQTIRVVVDAD